MGELPLVMLRKGFRLVIKVWRCLIHSRTTILVNAPCIQLTFRAPLYCLNVAISCNSLVILSTLFRVYSPQGSGPTRSGRLVSPRTNLTTLPNGTSILPYCFFKYDIFSRSLIVIESLSYLRFSSLNALGRLKLKVRLKYLKNRHEGSNFLSIQILAINHQRFPHLPFP